MSTWIEIDLNGLDHNYNHLKNLTGKEVFGVVKDNAYGHGIVEVARELEVNGVKILCVFSIDEAIKLRENDIKCDILIFAFTPYERVLESLHHDFIYTVASLKWFDSIRDIKEELRLHIEINTGMNRIGLQTKEDVKTVLSSHHKVEGIYTHFGNPANLEIGNAQALKFNQLLELIDHDFTWVHFGNAPVEVIRNNKRVNAARFGLGLYGYREAIEGLKPILSFYSEIEFVDRASVGETIGYDYTYEVTEAIDYATIPVGYSDGFDMRNAQSDLYINGEAVKVLGKICMNQTMLQYKNGDVVELIGPYRTAKKIHQETGIMPYVLVTCLHEKIKRNYIRK